MLTDIGAWDWVRTCMKCVKKLTEEEQKTLLDASRYAPWSRFRQRAHAVYLSGKGYRVNQLAEIFAVDRDTVAGWLDAWEQCGLMGLRDHPHPGRPSLSSEENRVWLEQELEGAPHQMKRLQGRWLERIGIPTSLNTLKRWLRKRGWVWKRCRRSLKEQRDSVAFEEAQRVLAAFHEREAAGELDVFYLDESGFQASSCVPYAWQRRGETRALPANVSGRINVIGLINLSGQGYFHPVDSTVTHTTVTEAITGFIRARRPEKLTIIVMDNASIHVKAAAEGQWDWLADRIWLWFLPTYSPELNPIEMLWHRIKYEWLPWAAYQCFDTLRAALQDIFGGFGQKYQVNFG